MKAEVGYITSWRRGIFFSLVAAIIFFGITNMVMQANVEVALVRNAVGVFALILGIFFVLFVVADPKGLYEGQGEVSITDEFVEYKDKKRKFKVKRNEVKKVDIKPIYLGQNEMKTLAYMIIVDTGKKKYYIESDRARGRQYNEVDLYRLYLYLQENISS